jgi:flavodoxin
MAGIVVYQSTYGSTKQYAEWIREETGFALHSPKDPAIPWEEADVVVVGCPVVANRPSLAGWLQRNWPRMRGKQVILFTTSGADPQTNPVLDWIRGSFPEEMRQVIQFFPLAGRFDFHKLRGFHKTMLWMVGFVFRNKDVKHQITHPVDGVARENLNGVLAAIALSRAPTD